ncbi:MAG: DUF1365 domain-containing protein [Gammaproteobacteria bacterium HGW-Gammaproteobacteria-14]|nr:MAG: DUF1365 domain-containing protein [Gammaproteobacteria bacterium HGW-Gammaproteobacteria-14]
MISEHALYTGKVWHRRQTPVVHEFGYPFWWLWVNLDDIDGLLERHRSWGRRWHLVTLRDEDYLDKRPGLLSQRVRHKALSLGLDWEGGQVCMLSQPRMYGWLFNPISLYWHFAPGSQTPDSVLAEVHNTPWHEQHWYPLILQPGRDGSFSCEHEKAFHVSPFMGMDMCYQWSFSLDNRALDVTIRNVAHGEQLFAAGVKMHRKQADMENMGLVLREYGAQGMKTSAAIYAHAWRLWRKGVSFHGHPGTGR